MVTVTMAATASQVTWVPPPFCRAPKEAGAFEAPGQTKEELCANDTSRHPKVFKLGAEHGCQ